MIARNSTHIWIEYAGLKFCLPWENDRPNFEGLPQYLRDTLTPIYAANINAIQIIPDLPPLPMPPNWEGLLRELLTGSLNPIFRKITLGAINDPAVLLARQDIYGAISNSAIEDRLSALRAGLDMLEAAMPLDQIDRDMWNSAIATLNFPDTVRL